METRELKDIFKHILAIVDTSSNKDEIVAQIKEYQKELLQLEPLEVRKQKFIDNVHLNMTEFFRSNKDQLDKFISCWTAVKDGGYKMRFEKEKKFYLKPRMTTWQSKSEQSKKVKLVNQLFGGRS